MTPDRESRAALDRADWRSAAMDRDLGWLEFIIHNLGELFPGLEVMDVTVFRITRNAEIELDDDDGDDLREIVEEEL